MNAMGQGVIEMTEESGEGQGSTFVEVGVEDWLIDLFDGGPKNHNEIVVGDGTTADDHPGRSAA